MKLLVGEKFPKGKIKTPPEIKAIDDKPASQPVEAPVKLDQPPVEGSSVKVPATTDRVLQLEYQMSQILDAVSKLTEQKSILSSSKNQRLY